MAELSKKILAAKLWKPFFFFFLIAYLSVNWNSVSWIFNYATVSAVTLEIFQKTGQSVEEAAVPENSGKEENKTIEPDRIEIEKIGIIAPLVILEDHAEDIYKELDLGVVHYPGSSFPGEAGQTWLLGHSAPLNWPKIRYTWVFSSLNDLEQGDEVIIYFENKKLSYTVTNKYFLERGEEIPVTYENNKNTIFLISCWPPGKNIMRIAVEAKQI